jgi:hypothetical protein
VKENPPAHSFFKNEKIIIISSGNDFWCPYYKYVGTVNSALSIESEANCLLDNVRRDGAEIIAVRLYDIFMGLVKATKIEPTENCDDNTGLFFL